VPSWRQLKRIAQRWWDESAHLALEAWQCAVARWHWVALGVLMTVVAVAGLMPQDRELLRVLRVTDTGALAWVGAAAQHLSYWGDFLGFNLVVLVSLALLSRARRSLFLRRVVLAAVLGTVISGTVANGLRAATGRTRPNAREAPGFHGPTLQARRHSFPSAHTATALGASVPVAVAIPPVGIPLVAVGSAIAWSRLQNGCHHPSDVLVSAVLATLVGVPLGWVARRRRKALHRRTRRATSTQLARAALKPLTSTRSSSGC
jgi:undecaprenyl-diphosphatase